MATEQEKYDAALALEIEKLVRDEEGIVASTLADNKDAGLIAVQIETGNVVIKQITKRVAPKLPMMVRGYADHPLFEVAVANTLNMALKQYRPNDKRAIYVADAVMQAAAVTAIQALNINELINEVLDGIEIPGFAQKGTKDA